MKKGNAVTLHLGNHKPLRDRQTLTIRIVTDPKS